MESTIEIAPEYVAGLSDVSVGEDLFVLTWLHHGDRTTLQVHPRDDFTQPLTGVFSTRSSDRPNPIGLHRVHVMDIESGRLVVRGLEAVDGSPVIDLKPILAWEGR
jgi:tRNA-Thr(GGU) m(6)t(6)A37 methyltransferase TsaA